MAEPTAGEFRNCSRCASGKVDVVQKVIRLEPGTTKNNDGREVFMTDAVRHVLGALVEGKSAD